MRDFSPTDSSSPAYADARGAGRRSGRAKGKPSLFARAFAAKRLGFLFSAGLLVVAGVGVPMNALFFQDGRHPSPLFAQATFKSEDSKTELAKADTPKADGLKSETPKAPPPAAPAASARAPSVASTRADPIAAAIESPRLDRSVASERAPVARPAPVRTDPAKTASVRHEAKKPAAAEKKQDPIGKLIGGGAPQAEAAESVLAAQQALLRLGYVVRANGVMSGATRQAIEKYERDNGLPATGKVTPKLLKKLAGQSASAQQ